MGREGTPDGDGPDGASGSGGREAPREHGGREAPREHGGREAPRAPDRHVAGYAGTGHPGARAMQARDRHDSGAMGDKVGVSDPAASPLGTDSESGGVREPEGSLEPVREPRAGLKESSAVPHGHVRGEYERGSGRLIWMTAAAAVSLLLALIVFVITVD